MSARRHLVHSLWLALAAATLIAACGGTEPAPVVDEYEVTLALSPSHPHIQEVITFTFNVTLKGSPVANLAPTASAKNAAGNTVTMTLGGGATPGTYVADKSLQDPGMWSVNFQFSQGEATFTRAFPINLEPH